MKLKNYFNPKKLMRRLSKSSISEFYCSINDSFTDYNDNDLPHTADTVSKDDMYLRPRKDGKVGVRTDMTQSFTGYLPSNFDHISDEDTETEEPFSGDSLTGSPLVEGWGSCESPSYDSCSSAVNSSVSSTSRNNVSCVYSERLHAGAGHQCACLRVSADGDYGLCSSCTWQYHSLPSSQTSNHIMQDIHYYSLPLSMAQSVYINNDIQVQTTPTVYQSTERRCRSRIKTNPWLPLPDGEKLTETLRRRRNTHTRAQPRLSRLFSEVEEVMREQLINTAADGQGADSTQWLGRSSESLASTCSTATEIPERKIDDEEDVEHEMTLSPSEGYKSSFSSTSSNLNLADTESLSDSRSSSISSLSMSYSSQTSQNNASRCRPSLRDFTAGLSTESDSFNLSSSSLVSDSSGYSHKYEVLKDKVRRLCQSTTDLDEKMRLARLESSFIKVK